MKGSSDRLTKDLDLDGLSRFRKRRPDLLVAVTTTYFPLG